jgi:hypothetical protein
LLPHIALAQLSDADLERMRADKRVALVIGNGNHRNFQRLDNPVNDATGVAAALRAAGFQVIVRLDATREDMSEALEQFDQALSKADIGLSYFAGHAAQVDWRPELSVKPAPAIGRWSLTVNPSLNRKLLPFGVMTSAKLSS